MTTWSETEKAMLQRYLGSATARVKGDTIAIIGRTIKNPTVYVILAWMGFSADIGRRWLSFKATHLQKL